MIGGDAGRLVGRARGLRAHKDELNAELAYSMGKFKALGKKPGTLPCRCCNGEVTLLIGVSPPGFRGDGDEVLSGVLKPLLIAWRRDMWMHFRISSRKLLLYFFWLWIIYSSSNKRSLAASLRLTFLDSSILQARTSWKLRKVSLLPLDQAASTGAEYRFVSQTKIVSYPLGMLQALKAASWHIQYSPAPRHVAQLSRYKKGLHFLFMTFERTLLPMPL